MAHTISFADVVKGRDAEVRVTADKLIYVVDLVMVMTGKDQNQAGEVLRRLVDNGFFNKSNFILRNTGTTRQTKLVSYLDAMNLVMILPGKIAKATRTQFASIIERYIIGDLSLIQEIEANAETNAALIKMIKTSNLLIQRRLQLISQQKAYVYAVKSEAFPEYIKIGRTYDLKKRIDSINTSMPIHPYRLLAAFETFDSKVEELKAHKHFNKYRGSGEFFKVGKAPVLAYFHERSRLGPVRC
jgi:T5orf172 domain